MIWKEEKEKLENLINAEKKSYEEIGRLYGVTGSTIKKQAIKLGIKLCPRREINPKETFNKGVPLKGGKYIKSNESPESKIDENIIIKKRLISGNHKNVGERGERIAIGELAKYDVDVMLPMSDNLPFDLVVYHNNKFFKCQIKTTNSETINNSLCFNLKTNNWYSKTNHKYTNDEVDAFILCDLNNIYLVGYNEIGGRSTFTIRNKITKSKQHEGVHFALDYIISEKRIDEVFK